MKFPPNWNGPQPEMISKKKIEKMLKSLEGKDENIKKITEEFIEMEKISFEIDQISYHRICGGGSIIVAPVNGDKTNQKQYDLVCAKCGVIKTVILPENHTVSWG